MHDVSEQIKAKVLARLDASSGVTDLVPASRIYPMTVPANQTLPFIRYGQASVDPYQDFCHYGSTVECVIHCVCDSEESAQAVSRQVLSSLEEMTDIVEFVWVRTQYAQSPDESSVWDGMVTIRVTDTHRGVA